MRPRKSLELCDCMVEKISRKIDAMTGDTLREAMYDEIDKVANVDQRNDLYLVIHQFALEQVSAAFQLGLQAATNPSPWIFEHEGH